MGFHQGNCIGFVSVGSSPTGDRVVSYTGPLRHGLLRSIRSHSDVPVIIITGHRLHDTDRILGLELGADGCIVKPFGLRELLARIRVVLRRAPASRLASSPISLDNPSMRSSTRRKSEASASMTRCMRGESVSDGWNRFGGLSCAAPRLPSSLIFRTTPGARQEVRYA